MNKLPTILMSILFIAHPFSVVAIEWPFGTKQMTHEEIQALITTEVDKRFKEKEEIQKQKQKQEEEKNRIAVQNATQAFQQKNRLIRYTQEEQVVVSTIRGILQLETEVAERNIKNPDHPRIAQIIEGNGNGYAANVYKINSKAHALSWEALGTGKIFSFLIHRWPYCWIHDLEKANHTAIIWRGLQEEECEIAIVAEGASDAVNTNIHPVHHNLTSFLCERRNGKYGTQRLQMNITGDNPCHPSGYKKQVIIRCPRYILLCLIAEEQQRSKRL